MLLAADIGNSTIVLGLFADGPGEDRLLKRFSVPASAAVEGGMEEALRDAVSRAGGVSGSVVCSVVPRAEEALVSAVESLYGVTPLVLSDGRGASEASGMALRVEDASTLGADRVVTALAAHALYGEGRDLAVVDSGTALTVDWVTPEGEFLGGAIAPGLALSAEALFDRAGRLPRVELTPPERAVGRTTSEALKSGLVLGFASLAEGLVARMERERGAKATVALTGGGAGALGDAMRADHTDPDLTLKGLRIIHERGKA